MERKSCIFLTLVVWCAGLSAQTPPPRAGAAGAPDAPGTAVIRGRVLAADTAKPLRRAQITVAVPGTRATRTASTDLLGRYEVRDLPAGRYHVSATRSGYLLVRLGQRRLSDPQRPIELADGQVVENIDFSLPRMGVISGRVLDPQGEPVDGAQVLAYRQQFVEGRRTLQAAGGPARADDTGAYRILSLTPGDYLVKAQSSETWTDAKTRAQMTFLPTYFGATADAGGAQRVRVAAGQEAAAVDVALTPTRTLRIAGTAMDALGRPLAGETVSMEFRVMGASGGMVMPMNARVNADGSFEFRNLTAGTYAITARTPRDKDGRSESVSLTLQLGGADIEHLTLVTGSGGSLSGRIVTEGGALPDLPAAGVVVTTGPVDPDNTPTFTFVSGNGQARDDFTFERTGLARRQRISVQLPAGWALASVMLDGVEVIDTGIEFKNGERIAGAELTITNQITRVSGRVTDGKGAAADDATIVIFGSDSSLWVPRSRHVKMARPDQTGQFIVEGLPPGEYRAVAVDVIDDGQWTDPEFLASMAGSATKFTLGKGERRTQDLRVTRRSR